MANEFKHKDPCSTLTQAEYIAACGDGHIFACQATGDIAYASSATVLSKLGKGAAGTVLSMGCSCIPAWTTNAASATLAATVVVVDGTDTSSFVAIFDCATGSLAPKTDAGLAYNAGTGTLTATAFAGPITGNVTGNASGTALTVTQAAQCAITSLGTLTALQVDFINANASTVTITDSTDTGDLASLAVTTHGATTLTTTDDDAAAAHFTVDADGNITLDSATGIVTIEDGGTEVLRFTESCSGDVTVKLVTNAKDLIFTDNGDAEGFRILDAAAGVNVAGLLTAGSLDIDNVLINGTTIGHTCDTDLMTVGNACLTIKGDVTVGVCGTGHDVKFFGDTAGAYMIYDQSEDQLEIRGAAADATTSTGKLLLSTALTDINANDVIGSISFQAPLETGTDAVKVSASITAVAQGTFAANVNATDIIFYTAHDNCVAERFRFTSQGEIGIAGANYGNDGQVLTSTGAGTAVAWECAGSADISSRVYTSGAQSISNACDNLVLWQSESYDTNSMHGTNACQCHAEASSKLTAKTAGKYHISAQFQFATNATGFRGGYFREGGDTTLAAVRQTSVCGTGKPQIHISTDYDLGACEYVQLLIAQNSGGSLNLENGAGVTWFAMHKIN